MIVVSSNLTFLLNKKLVVLCVYGGDKNVAFSLKFYV